MGEVYLGTFDVRPDSPTFMHSNGFRWTSTDGFAVTVPAGVAHGVYFFDSSVLVFGLSKYWTKESDSLGCRWDDPALKIDWPMQRAALSERDASSGSLEQLLKDYRSIFT
jgi:dTDP-4-dehydrorhamnose 3,5-epimerase